jgi:cytochrome b subunit of formate dehydrogenase
MKKRSTHDKLVLWIVRIVTVLMIVAGCCLDSEQFFAEFFSIICFCEFILIWFIVANKERLG